MFDRKKTVDIRLKHPFTAVVAGPTGSGKTRLLMRLIKSAKWMSVNPPEEIIYCYGEWQKVFDELPEVNFHDGMIDVDRDIPKDNRPRWLIIDDLMEEVVGTKESNKLYTKGSHHKNISVFFVVQNPFKNGLRTVSLNTHYFFFMKNPRDNQMIVNFAKQSFPGRVDKVRDAYQHATSEPYGYLLVDLRQETDDDMRLIGNWGNPSREMIVFKP